MLILPTAERELHYIEPFVSHQQDFVLEEMRLHRWSSMKRNRIDRERLEE